MRYLIGCAAQRFHVGYSDVMYVAVPPRITRGPVSRSDVEGSSVTLQCRVIAAPYPDTVISWTKDRHQLDVRHQSTLTQCTLVNTRHCVITTSP